MHGVRHFLLEQKAKSLNIPVEIVNIQRNESSLEYEENVNSILLEYQNNGVTSVVFQDIYLDDVKKYRQKNLSKIGMKGIFPIWKKNSLEIVNKFIKLGFKAIVTCVDTKFLDKSFIGRNLDIDFLSDLTPDVDPSVENGEYHSFVYDGQIFKNKISFNKGMIVLREYRLYYYDLIPMLRGV
jgi:uncharacterized protein (TIGR00290 family)